MAIPFLLAYFLVKSRLKGGYNWLVWMFFVFITSCGFTHLLGVMMLYVPMYRLDGLVKLITAVASVATVLGMVWFLPKLFENVSFPRVTAVFDKANKNIRMYVALIAAVTILGSANGWGLLALNQTMETAEWRSHAYEGVIKIDSLKIHLRDTIGHQRSYIFSGERRFLLEYGESHRNILGVVEELMSFMGDNRSQLERLGEFAEAYKSLNKRMDAGILDRKSLVLDDDPLLVRVLAAYDELRSEEMILVNSRTKGLFQDFTWVVGIKLVAFLTGLVIIVSIFVYMIGQDSSLRQANSSLNRAYEEISDKNKLLDNIIGTSFNGHVLMGEDAVILGWNPAAAKIFGWTADEVVGRSVEVIIPEAQRPAHRLGIQRYLSTGEGPIMNKIVNLSALHKDGHEFPLEITITAVKHHGMNVFSAFMNDITERLLAEKVHKEYQTVFDMASDMICISTPNGFLKVNRAFEKFTGLTNQQLVSRGWTPYVHPDDEEMTTKAAERLHAENKPLINFENRWVLDDGSVKWLVWSCVPDQDGKIAYCIARDITEKKAIEEKLRAVNAELEQFAYVASHDLKAPLRGITNLSTWIMEDMGDKLTEESRGHMGLLQRRIVRMNNLIEGILQYSRVGRVNTDSGPVDLNLVVADVADNLHRPGFRINVPELPVVIGNRITLTQVFQNLISNGINHHPMKEGNIDVTVREDGKFWEFSVRDDGAGIDPKFFDKLFVPFQTLRPKDEVESTGIGLALCKKIVERAGGKIWVESAVGKGADFKFTWPREQK